MLDPRTTVTDPPIKLPLPTPVRHESRTCFGISWFATEADATRYAIAISDAGITYNGGFMHGRPCGRDLSWDYVKDGVKLFAVTD